MYFRSQINVAPLQGSMFGLVGDGGVRDNATAFAAAVAYMNANGGQVQLGRGIYRTSAVIPALTSHGTGFLGVGAGMPYTTQNTGPAGSTYGTVIRLDAASGDLITINPTANGTVIRDIGFWPVQYKTSGSEIKDRGLNTLIEGVTGAFGYAFVLFGGGANGSTLRHARAFGFMGPQVIQTQGSSNAPSDWAQGIVIDDYVNYTPFPVADPIAATTTAAWAATTGYLLGAATVANGYVWQATTAGTSAGAGIGPSAPAFPFAGAYTDAAYRVTDGTVVWQAVQRATQASVDIDSNSVDITVKSSQILSSWRGVYIHNSLASTIPPQYLKVVDTLIDHTISDCVYASSGYQITLSETDLHWSALGRGFSSTSGFVGGLRIAGGHIYNNALDGIQIPPIANSLAVVTGAKIAGNGVAASNTYSGVVAGANTTKFTINNNIIGPDSASSGTMKYGVDIATGCDGFSVLGNVVVGNGTSGIANAAGTSASKIISGNPE